MGYVSLTSAIISQFFTFTSYSYQVELVISSLALNSYTTVSGRGWRGGVWITTYTVTIPCISVHECKWRRIHALNQAPPSLSSQSNCVSLSYLINHNVHISKTFTVDFHLRKMCMPNTDMQMMFYGNIIVTACKLCFLFVFMVRGPFCGLKKRKKRSRWRETDWITRETFFST